MLEGLRSALGSYALTTDVSKVWSKWVRRLLSGNADEQNMKITLNPAWVILHMHERLCREVFKSPHSSSLWHITLITNIQQCSKTISWCPAFSQKQECSDSQGQAEPHSLWIIWASHCFIEYFRSADQSQYFFMCSVAGFVRAHFHSLSSVCSDTIWHQWIVRKGTARLRWASLHLRASASVFHSHTMVC